MINEINVRIHPSNIKDQLYSIPDLLYLMDGLEAELYKKSCKFMSNNTGRIHLGFLRDGKKQSRHGNLCICEYDNKSLIHTDKYDPLPYLVCGFPKLLVGICVVFTDRTTTSFALRRILRKLPALITTASMMVTDRVECIIIKKMKHRFP